MLKSRKLVLALVGLGLVTVGFLATAWSEVLAGQYTVFVGAVSGVLGLFMASNVGSQFVERKGQVEQHKATVEAQALADQHITSLDPPVEQIPPG